MSLESLCRKFNKQIMDSNILRGTDLKTDVKVTFYDLGDMELSNLQMV